MVPIMSGASKVTIVRGRPASPIAASRMDSANATRTPDYANVRRDSGDPKECTVTPYYATTTAAITVSASIITVSVILPLIA